MCVCSERSIQVSKLAKTNVLTTILENPKQSKVEVYSGESK